MHQLDILAAGAALGRAGLWYDCLDYAKDPSSIVTYGPVSQRFSSPHT